MSRHDRATRHRAKGGADQGSVLILVLVMMILGSLIVIPLLQYATGISRQNTVLSDKTRRQEAVKAALRTALSDPAKLYHHCAQASSTLASPGIDGIPMSNRCEFISFSLAEADEDLHLGLVATRVGETIPPGLEAIVQTDSNGDIIFDSSGNPMRYVYASQTTDANEWLDPLATFATSPVSAPRQIWLPNLPVHYVNLRGPSGFQMPSGYPECTVYFPGTYTDPVVLDGPTFFTSGIYYFQDVVTVTAGADVVVGMGQHEGCTTDQEAVFYATNAPGVHNIKGLGATWLFGANTARDTNGKLVITNEDGTPKIRFNQRYVNDDDTGGQPSFGVSIASVNGKLVSGPDSAGQYVLADLDVAGIDKVPYSKVGPHDGLTPPVSAGTSKMQPSTLTFEPQPPDPPTITTAPIALRTGGSSTDGAVRVMFNEVPPENRGGLPILEYVVTSSPGAGTCVPTTSPFECIVTGLTDNTNYTFTVTARNAAGTSDPSAASAAARPHTSGGSQSPLVTAPSTPTAPTAVRYLDNTVRISWTAPNSNNSPISKYTVTANPAIDPVTKPCLFITATSCIIRNLPTYDPDDLLDLFDLFSDYTFTVSATNERGTSATSPASLTSILIPPALGSSPADPPVVPPVVVPAYEPPPIIDIELSKTNPAVIDIPGYVSIPMGIFRLNNPHGLGSGDSTVAVTGGVLAGGFRVEDDRAVNGELTVPIGLVNPIVQRTFKIISTTTSGTPVVQSVAIVQVNQNGAYAINSWSVQ